MDSTSRDEGRGCGIEISEDGSVVVNSKDNHAKLVLYPDGHRVRVTFVARISRCENEKQRQNQKTQDGVPEMKSRQCCVWQDRIFTTRMCPQEWKYALNIAKMVKSGQLNTGTDGHKSLVPHTIPQSCPRQFTHEWRNISAYDSPTSSFDTGSDLTLPYQRSKSPGHCHIKLLWSENVTYWVSSAGGTSSVEAWLDNGAVLKSHPTSERYYISVYPFLQKSLEAPPAEQYANGKFVERVISSAALPQQDNRLKSVMLRSIRLGLYCQEKLDYSMTVNQSLSPCWATCEGLADAESGSAGQSETCTPDELTVHEKVEIANVGVFSAVDDSIQIQFFDGSMLHMTADIKNIRKTQAFNFSSLMEDQCRIMLGSGEYHVPTNMLQTQQEVSPYMNLAVEWLQWLMRPQKDRLAQPFCSDSILGPKKADMVLLEIEKNHRFNYLLSKSSLTDWYKNQKKDGRAETSETQGTVLSHRELHKHQPNDYNTFSYLDVHNALCNTSKAIDDLNSVINSLKGGA